MESTMTPERVEELKREAKAMKDAERIKHHEALRRIAEREGFANWAALIAAAGGGEIVREVVRDIRVSPDKIIERAARRARYGGGNA